MTRDDENPPDEMALTAATRGASPGDSVAALLAEGVDDDRMDPPLVCSFSDVHGYWDAFVSTLALPGDHDAFPPLVEADGDGDLHWVGGEDGRGYVLVCNGDMVDRGGDGDRIVETIRRLQREAPAGHVRYTLGNHEQFVLAGGGVGPPEWFCNRATVVDRRSFFEAIADGAMTAAYAGYGYTYSHGGSPDGIDVPEANDELRAAAAEVAGLVGTDRDSWRAFAAVFDDEWVTRAGSTDPKGGDAGPLWLGWTHLPADAPPQVVGHTPHDRVTRKGTVVCTDVTRNNTHRSGGAALTVERPRGDRHGVPADDGDTVELGVLERADDGTVTYRVV